MMSCQRSFIHPLRAFGGGNRQADLRTQASLLTLSASSAVMSGCVSGLLSIIAMTRSRVPGNSWSTAFKIPATAISSAATSNATLVSVIVIPFVYYGFATKSKCEVVSVQVKVACENTAGTCFLFARRGTDPGQAFLRMVAPIFTTLVGTWRAVVMASVRPFFRGVMA